MNKKKIRRIKYDHYGYFFVAPFIVTFLIFQLYPIIHSLNLSLTDLNGWNTEYNYVGLSNFKTLFSSEIFLEDLRNTCIIWGINFLPQLGIALLIAAWFTDAKLNVKGTGIYKVLFYMPGILTAASIAILFASLLRYPEGPINSILLNLHIIDKPFEFFRNKWATRLTVSFIQFWMFYGSTVIMLIAAILGIDISLFESAMLDGATGRQIFFKITLPLIKPIMLYLLVTSMIGGLQIFDIPFLMTNEGPDNAVGTIATFIYKQAFTGGRNFGLASAASVILLFIIIICSVILFKIMGNEDEKKQGGNKRG